MKEKQIRVAIAIVMACVMAVTIGSVAFPSNSPKVSPSNLLAVTDQLAGYVASLQARPVPTATPTTILVTPTSGIIFETKISISPSPRVSLAPRIVTSSPTVSKAIPSPTRLPTARPTAKPTTLPTPTSALTIKLSSSKLGIFVIADYSAGARAITESCPRIVKFIDPQGNEAFIGAARKYKQTCKGTVVARFYPGTEGIKYSTSDDPEQSAEDFFGRAIRPNLDALGNDKSLFDYLQMPNEFENTPEWWGEEKMRWNGRFWVKLTALNKSAGIKTCIGSMPVGNTTGQDMSYIVDELRTMKGMGAALCYHGYTFHYSTDAGVEEELSLRYRKYYSFFRESAPDLADMPLILSEGGAAENGDPHGGYKAAGHAQTYESWLAWFDRELRKDPYVIGVTLFQIGNDSDWDSFNLEQIAPWMADYIKK